MAAFAAVGALYFSNSTLSASNDQLVLARQTAQSELFKSAAEQLDSSKESVRLSGVYLLERLAQDSVADQPTARRLLEAFVRTETVTEPCEIPDREPPVDIQAALDVIAKYGALPGPTPTVNLFGACLTATYLGEVDLTGASLYRADFTGADLTGAVLVGADFYNANLTGASLYRANLTDAILIEANLAGAELTNANLTSADLTRANLTGALLTGANLTGVHLTGIVYDGSTKWPEGFIPPQSA